MIITKIGYAHCSRGSVMCPKCKEAEARTPDFALVKLFSYAETSFPSIEYNNKWYSYEIVERFTDEKEMLEYSNSKIIEIY